jgi:hypothetical protein
MFVLIVVEDIPDMGPRRQVWGAFHAHAGIENLKKEEGVYYIAMNAWIFDLRESLKSYTRVLHRATELDIRTLVVPLHEGAIKNMVEHPRSGDLHAFVGRQQAPSAS